MNTIMVFDYIFPVVGCRRSSREPDHYGVAEVFGTAFSIGHTAFLTAAHVVAAARLHPSIGLAKSKEREWHVRPVTQYEVFDDYDVALVGCDLPGAKAMPWQLEELPTLFPVEAWGFPFALDREERVIRSRGFRGEIVSPRTWGKLKARPRAYELSFMCPRGISGGPLLAAEDTRQIAGLVFGNLILDMVVYSETETDTAGKKTTVFQKVEAMSLGLAIQTTELLRIRSDVLGKTIGDHVRENGLLA